MSATPWNSLEIHKTHHQRSHAPSRFWHSESSSLGATARIEQAQWASQKVVEYRLKVFETVAPKLNKLLCFYTFVGRWKELTQSDVLILKRELDEAFYVNRALFSSALLNEYQSFTRTLFEMYAERGS